jgi:hypothetical protein
MVPIQLRSTAPIRWLMSAVVSPPCCVSDTLFPAQCWLFAPDAGGGGLAVVAAVPALAAETAPSTSRRVCCTKASLLTATLAYYETVN